MDNTTETITEKEALRLAQSTLMNAIVYITLTSHHINHNKYLVQSQLNIIRDISQTAEKIAKVIAQCNYDTIKKPQ